MKAKYFNFSAFLLLVTLMVFSSCKKEFDEPPISELPNLVGNATIASIVAMAQPSPVALGSQVLEATVVADDKSGNFYKQLVIQDSTGGLRVDIDAFGIYTDFPIGRKVWVKCEGLFIWKDGDVPALIGSSNTNTSRIPQSTYKQFIIGGEYDQPLTPTVKTLSTLTPADYHTLIQLDNVEFAGCYAGGTYSYASTQQSKNAELTECATGGLVIVRNSGFASFSNEFMPTQNGSIIAVYNSFSGTSQLFIRDPSDVSSMTDPRCVPLPNYPTVTIPDLRSQFSGVPVAASGKVRGIVISDVVGEQWFPNVVVIQEPGAGGEGIAIRFTDDHPFALGDYIEVKLDGLLEEFNGLLRVSNVATSCASTLPNSGNLTVIPRVATVADIIVNANAWESTLVNVQNANLNGGATYADFGILINDATGSATLFSAFSAFKDVAIPTGTGDITSVVSEYNGLQLLIRGLYDVNIAGSGGGGGGGGGQNLNQITIADTRALFTGSATNAPDTTKITGIVISDLNGGNLVPQNMVIQEANGSGITVRFAANHSFNLGDEVEVNISNQTIEEFNGLLQVNGVPNANATVLSSGNTITPRQATVADIMTNGNTWESTLVNVVAASLSGGTTYGDFGILLNDASGSISMFSAFSNFASTAIPTGTGDVTGIVGDYNGIQINIRDTWDVNFSGGGGGGGSVSYISIAATRALYTGASTSAPASTGIRGIVISDLNGGNLVPQNMVIQEVNGSGITVRFAANHSFNLGDEVEVDISGQTIEEFNGLLQVNGVPNANATVVSSGNTITPRQATVADIMTNGNTWESTLVNVIAASLTGGTTYGDFGILLNDASGSISMFSAFSNFATTAIPTGTGDVTGIVGDYNGIQINIRDTWDVNFSGGGGGGGVNYISIGAARALFTGSATNAPANTGINGIVISDKDNDNITAKNLVLQQTGGAGIIVRFSVDNTTISEGDSITVDISGADVSEFNGLLQVSNVPNANATVISSGNSITPNVLTIAQLTATPEAYESTLIKINGATITGAATYSGTTQVSDGGGSIDMYTRPGATFSGTTVPGGTVSVTAIMSQFTSYQINIRNTTDVQ